MTRYAYLVSRYPEVSHTFIRREIDALRRLGLELDTFSLKRTDDEHLLSERDRRDADETFSIRPTSTARVLRDHLEAAAARPVAYVGTLGKAFSHRAPGAKAALWGLFHFAEAIVLARELERRGVSHLHCHFANSGATVGLLAARYAGLPFSMTVHGISDLGHPKLLREKVEATRFTACASHFIRSQVMHCTDPGEWRRLVVVHCGLDLDAIDEVPRRPRAPGKPPRLLAIGRLAPEKGFTGLVDAFAGVVARGLGAELRIIGEGPTRRRIEERVAAHGLGDRCTLVGALPEGQVIEEVAAADLLVMSSFIEGLPVVLMEALSLEVPVVAPRVAGIPELVEDGVSGWLFAPGDFEELETRLVDALTHPESWADFGRRGRERVEREFGAAASSTRMRELLSGTTAR